MRARNRGPGFPSLGPSYCRSKQCFGSSYIEKFSAENRHYRHGPVPRATLPKTNRSILWPTACPHLVSYELVSDELIRKRIAWTALGLLSFAGLLSLYYLAFAVWMTAYPFANFIVWRTRFYQRLAVTMLIIALWGFVALWLIRHRNGPPEASG